MFSERPPLLAEDVLPAEAPRADFQLHERDGELVSFPGLPVHPLRNESRRHGEERGLGGQGGVSARAPPAPRSGRRQRDKRGPGGGGGRPGTARPLLGGRGQTGGAPPGQGDAGSAWPAATAFFASLSSFPKKLKAKVNILIGQLCKIIFNLDRLDISSGVTNSRLKTKFRSASLDW